MSDEATTRDRVRIAVAAEERQHERRVALVPDLVGKLTAAGYSVAVQSGAGRYAHAPDDAYRETGAYVGDDALDGAGVVLSVQPLTLDRAAGLAEGTTTMSFLPTGEEPALVRRFVDRRVTSYALELVPRISRAQSMDALSSQSVVSGYRAAVVAAERLRLFFPLSMTAAGTIRPANVLVLGAGVAGLQAIATARRLGAVVSAYDVRPAAAEEVASMGVKFVELDLESLEGAGGYAREMSEERSRRQRELLAPYVAEADALITTAAVPGRHAPLLVTSEMVAGMKSGSVVVDLAAEQGGNVEGVQPGIEELTDDGITVCGGRNVPSEMPAPASRLLAHNLVELVLALSAGGRLVHDFDDEIVASCCVTHDGQVRHEPTRELLGGGA